MVLLLELGIANVRGAMLAPILGLYTVSVTRDKREGESLSTVDFQYSDIFLWLEISYFETYHG